MFCITPCVVLCPPMLLQHGDESQDDFYWLHKTCLFNVNRFFWFEYVNVKQHSIYQRRILKCMLKFVCAWNVAHLALISLISTLLTKKVMAITSAKPTRHYSWLEPFERGRGVV